MILLKLRYALNGELPVLVLISNLGNPLSYFFRGKGRERYYSGRKLSIQIIWSKLGGTLAKQKKSPCNLAWHASSWAAIFLPLSIFLTSLGNPLSIDIVIKG